MSGAPTSTYRLQVRAQFGFDDVAGIAVYLARLGVSDAYLSPILQAVPGSAHGYDVVDHARLSDDAGGSESFHRMIATLGRQGLRAVADVVPNHMAVPTPARLNAALWSVLRDGPESEYARWFDIDWTPGQLLMPVLGRPIGQVVSDGELRVDTAGPEPVLRYFDHGFPIRAGTEMLPMAELVTRQWYRLAWWRVGSEELNYRRFFDVTTLAAIRVEDVEVFDASHALLLELVRDGSLHGLRIDHPDGLADPRGYLRRLADATEHAWVVVEKVLEDDERLPADWSCAGTTGYDALNQVGGLFVDPDGRLPLTRALLELTHGELDYPEQVGDVDGEDLDRLIEDAKSQVLDSMLIAEMHRLVGLLVEICADDLNLRDHTRWSLGCGLSELVTGMDRYRAYVVPGEPPPAESIAAIERAASIERHWMDEEQRSALAAVSSLALDSMSGDARRDEFVIRFQQLCGPVMAKGIEDTAFYRWERLLALNEVGASPHRFGHSPTEFHAFAGRLQRDWPATMTTLSTHDTKRSEDARARLLAISEVPDEWAVAVRGWTALSARHRPDRQLTSSTVYVLWQTLIATWGVVGPPEVERIVAYLRKAGREAKIWTFWTAPSEAYEDAVTAFARAVLADSELIASIDAFVRRLAVADRANVLGQKLIQLTMPGVPDVYQGCEIVNRSLVDPDNRRPVDFARRRDLLARLDAGQPPAEFPEADRLDAEKLLVTSRALRLRRDHPEWFDRGYTPIPTSSQHAIAFGRGGEGDGDGSHGLASDGPIRAITVATRHALRLAAAGGWHDATLTLPDGSWTNVLASRPAGGDGLLAGGSLLLTEVLAELPVALLIRSV